MRLNEIKSGFEVLTTAVNGLLSVLSQKIEFFIPVAQNRSPKAGHIYIYIYMYIPFFSFLGCGETEST
jgi:hypothetical protein